nr:unnamed protein product [Callosobruchus analis]
MSRIQKGKWLKNFKVEVPFKKLSKNSIAMNRKRLMMILLSKNLIW